jgi:hypothetical protein
MGPDSRIAYNVDQIQVEATDLWGGKENEKEKEVVSIQPLYRECGVSDYAEDLSIYFTTCHHTRPISKRCSSSSREVMNGIANQMIASHLEH